MVIATLLFGAASLYLQVFVIPHTPRLATGDQSIYLHNAARMLSGELIYRDYDHFTFPGTDLLYAALFRIFGVRAWIPQAMLVVVGVAMAWLMMNIAKTVMRGAICVLPALLFLALPFSSYLDATHHWYSALAAMAALAVIVERRTPFRLAIAGVLWGLAICFSQSAALGALGFACYPLWEQRAEGKPSRLLLKQEACYWGGFVVTVAAIVSYFVSKVGFARFFYYTVTFVLKYYPADSFNTWRVYLHERPSLHVWANWPDLVAWPVLHLLIPLIYVLFFAYARLKGLGKQQRERLMLINVTGISMFLAIASAPAWNRLYTVSAPGIILLVWFVDSRIQLTRVRQLLWILAIALLAIKPVVMQMRWKGYLDLPTGQTAVLEPAVYDKMQWIAARTRPGEYYFGDQLAGFALRLKDPARVAFLRPTDYTRPEEVQDVIQGLEQHEVRFVSWYPGLNVPLERPGNHLRPLVEYLQIHYHMAKVFSNKDELWERNQ